MNNKKTHKGIIIGLLLVMLSACGAGAVLTKRVKLNHPHGVIGADISSYQGEADWEKLSQKLDFVFVKATEGSTYTDDRFEYNFCGAMDAGLYTGAYHFFSFDSEGAAQAENFISAMESTGRCDGMLPPVIDVELYGDYLSEPKSADEVRPQLEAMIAAIEKQYGTKPVIYCTGRAYRLYKDCFEDCPLWERNVYFRPLHDDWCFWQYSDTEVLDGYNGDEKYIDMNYFKGDIKELAAMRIGADM